MRIPVLACLAVTAILASCALPGGASSGSLPLVQHFGISGSYTYDVDLGATPRDLYFVFTNTNLQYGSQKPAVGTVLVDSLALPAPAPTPLADSPDPPLTTMDKIRAFQKTPVSLTRGSAVFPEPTTLMDTEGSSVGGPFNDSFTAGSIAATCRKVVSNVVTDQGTRTLNIWVADDCWNAGAEGTSDTGGKRHGVTQAMVDALAGKFLLAGLGNDIYDWDTTMLGPEWGTHDFPAQLIGANGEITILLSDIEADNSDDGGIVGYFDSLNNFTKTAFLWSADSNERIMFVVDAVMYANPNADGTSTSDGTSWATTDYWAEETFSTLAHEFQHMIQYYQKGILARAENGLSAQSAETWINEMCSQLAEDLLSDKLAVVGPRGVSPLDGSAGSAGNYHGRIPDFNDSLDLSLQGDFGSADFATVLSSYSTAYAFGAWLARDYGGAEFLRRVVQSAAVDSKCITDAVAAAADRSIDMASLLERWAVSVLASGKTDMPPGYSFNRGGWFDSSAGSLAYKLGSIDFFNYSPPPQTYSAAGYLPSGSFGQASNLYFLAKAGATGKQSWRVTVPAGVGFSVYAAR
jgi:hypothetical protein